MILIAVTIALTQPLQAADTSTYRDSATARLVAAARVRHREQDTLVHDYQALVRTRVDAGFGSRRFAVIPPLVATETAARITWARPNDLHIRVDGFRWASALRGVNQVETSFTDPWFVPRGLGDSIRFVDDEIPETAALHPLAFDGESFYRYAIFDSLSIVLPDRTIRAIGVRVEPKRMAPALVVGNLWLDAATSEVVRLTLAFVGDYLWSTPEHQTPTDSAEALKENRMARRILRVEADLEYALHEARYWMPYRQLVTLTVDIPVLLRARVPVRFLSTFSEYRINTGIRPQFTIALDDSAHSRTVDRRGCPQDDRAVTVRVRDDCPPDAGAARWQGPRARARTGFRRAELWPNGRWEVDSPPLDSLRDFPWPDKLALAPDPAAEQQIRETTEALTKLTARLPADWVGRTRFGVAYEQIADVIRFNRVQGLSLGAGLQFAPTPYTTLLGSVRYGFSDKRPTGSLTLRRDAPGGLLEATLFRAVRETEPWTKGQGIGNTMNGVFAGHDDADYYLALGGGLTFTANHGLFRDVELGARVEHQTSMSLTARSGLNDLLGGDGNFPINPGTLEGVFARAWVARRWSLGRAAVAPGIEGLVGDSVRAARGWIAIDLPFTLLQRTGALTLRSGATVGDSIPQLLFRAGGPQTVRGYDYGTRRGRAFWSAQLDYGLTRQALLSPVAFVDVGNTFGAGRPLVSVGGGLSVIGGLIRFNVSKGLSPSATTRFDLLFRAPR